MKPADATYVALPSWDGRQWQVRVEDYDYNHRCDITAGRLDDVPDNVRDFVARQGGACMPDTPVWVRAELPDEIEVRLDLLAELVEDAAHELDDIVGALLRINMSAVDVVALLNERPLEVKPSRPLLMPNAEVVLCRLTNGPDAIALRWEDSPLPRQVFCRTCVARYRSPMGGQPCRCVDTALPGAGDAAMAAAPSSRAPAATSDVVSQSGGDGVTVAIERMSSTTETGADR